MERLLALGLGPSVLVSSAGTAAVVGHPIDRPMASLVAAAGADVDGFAARQVTPALLREADLVLALTASHRARLVELAPATVRRTHTLLEFARIARLIDLAAVPQATPGERLRAIVPMAAAMKPLVRRRPGETDDVPDPYGRDARAYDLAMTLIREATTAILDVARG